ncbi:hypothetical protein [Streptomyces canus]|uniref:hypothetical protein n=1 Tax=Streptomyces canus TaxID=58343 RepID=UPI0022551B2D|nr:hypothetical protein [Streptomyces canus]MCX4856648.1 hypothetical protein [Streptomyces canus]
MGELSRRSSDPPGTGSKRWNRVERQRLRDAQLDAEVRKIEQRDRDEVGRIREAGRAQLDADRAEYTTALATHVGANYLAMHHDFARLQDAAAGDPVLRLALAEIEYTGLQVLKSHLADRQRDGHHPPRFLP